jgi:predicted transcriptional regulator
MVKLAYGVELTATDAACLDAIRAGVRTKTRIAIATKRDLKSIGSALSGLSSEGLITQSDRYAWRLTEVGGSCDVIVLPESSPRRRGRRSGKIVPGSTADRLLELLDQPKRGSELADRLNVSPQCIHQLIVRHHAHGRLKLGDPDHVMHIVARPDDPSVLLTQGEERVLSALPDDAPALATSIAATVGIATIQIQAILLGLREKGLICIAGSVRDRTTYCLTADGSSHFQRQAAAPRAVVPQPLVKSDRIHSVLSFLAERDQARIRDVRDALGIPHNSMNALMQYLKRRGFVEKAAATANAPYTLTEAGSNALNDMRRRPSHGGHHALDRQRPAEDAQPDAAAG